MADTSVEPNAPVWGEPPASGDLEGRVQRLEDVVATLCNTQPIEERLRERIIEQLRPEVQRLVQRPGEVPPEGGPALGELGESPDGQVPPTEPPAAAPAPPVSFLRDLWGDIRTFWRMVRDPLFPMSWSVVVMPVLAVLYLIWSRVFGFSSIPILGAIFDFIGIFVVTYLVYKVLARELRRYRDTMARWGRPV